MQSYQFIFEYSGVIDAFTSIKLQPEEIDDYKFVSREEVLINLNNYGGAVQIWAKGENIGYFEQTVKY